MMARDHVWYCCYGSNLSRQRFLCYIVGGTPKYGKNKGEGSRDKNFPDIHHPFMIKHKLFFALPDGRKATGNWGTGGVAFIDLEPTDVRTYGRLWKITTEQFQDVMRQEGKWYNEILKLGEKEGLPIFTLTMRTPGLNFQVGRERPMTLTVMKPSEPYLKTIIEGLKETYPDLSKRDILNYLLELEGIDGGYEYDDMLNIYSSLMD